MDLETALARVEYLVSLHRDSGPNVARVISADDLEAIAVLAGEVSAHRTQRRLEADMATFRQESAALDEEGFVQRTLDMLKERGET